MCLIYVKNSEEMGDHLREIIVDGKSNTDVDLKENTVKL
jgi:hypothetical protein